MADISRVSDISIDNINALGGVAKSSIGLFGGLTVPAGGGFYPTTIDYSCRINDDDNANLTWTPGSSGNRQKWSISMWLKRGNLGIRTPFFNGNQDWFEFYSDDTMWLTLANASYRLKTNQVFRDPSSWFHFLMVLDTTQATDTNRWKVYINGSEINQFLLIPVF